MNTREANAVLALAAQFDGRKPDADAAVAWAEALDGLRLDDCLSAVRAHYRTSTDWLLPGEIRRRVNVIRQDRIERGKPFLVPPDFDNLDDEQHALAYRRWESAALRALADGEEPDRAGRLGVGPSPDVRAQLTEACKPPNKPDQEAS